ARAPRDDQALPTQPFSYPKLSRERLPHVTRPRFGQHGQRSKTGPVRDIRAQVRLLQDLGSDAIGQREEAAMPIATDRYTVTEPGNFYDPTEPSPLPKCGVELVDHGRTVVVDVPGSDLPGVVIHHAPLADYQVLELSEWADRHGLLWSMVPGVDG